jgi:cytochrome c peroxidase
LIAQHQLSASSLKKSSSSVFTLGKKLFEDNRLSSDETTSCSKCHTASSTENLPLSKGVGNVILKRNSQQLFNLGSESPFAFHDGRVSFTEVGVTIPSELSQDITQNFSSALEAQILFPIINRKEMRGMIGSNDLASISDDEEYLREMIAENILSDGEYINLFQSAYPGRDHSNPAFVSKSISHFIENNFSITTAYDDYLNGSNGALTESQKRGFLIFLGKGQCIRCHNGNNLTDNKFHSVGVPQIFPNLSDSEDDLGRAHTSGLAQDKYKFKTPSLRGVRQTGPFMHDGAFSSLSEVVEHYNNISASLRSYQVTNTEQQFYSTQILVDKNETRNQLRFNQIDSDPLKRGLSLQDSEKEDLVLFLNSL